MSSATPRARWLSESRRGAECRGDFCATGRLVRCGFSSTWPPPGTNPRHLLALSTANSLSASEVQLSCRRVLRQPGMRCDHGKGALEPTRRCFSGGLLHEEEPTWCWLRSGGHSSSKLLGWRRRPDEPGRGWHSRSGWYGRHGRHGRGWYRWVGRNCRNIQHHLPPSFSLPDGTDGLPGHDLPVALGHLHPQWRWPLLPAL